MNSMSTEEEVLIKIVADDESAKGAFQELENEADNAAQNIQGSFGKLDFTNISNSVSDVNNSLGDCTEDIQNYGSAARGASEPLADFNETLNGTADAAEKADNHTSIFLSTASALAGLGIGTMLKESVGLADKYNVSWQAIDYAFGKAGVSHKQVNDSIKNLQKTTSVSAGQARSFYQLMGNLGVTNTNLLSNSLKTAYGQAGLTGLSFETMTTAMRNMVVSGMAGTRQLKNLGITSDMLKNNLGMTSKEFQNAFKDATAEQRLEMLNKAMGDTSKGSEIMKNSMQGNMDKFHQAIDGALIPLGQAVIPALTMAVHALIPLLNSFAEAMKIPGVKEVVAGLMLFAGSLLLLSTGLRVVNSLKNLENLETVFSTITGGFAKMTTFMMANPIILVVVAIVALIVALEKLGEYMGWWTSWGDMIGQFKDALIGAGQVICVYVQQIGQFIYNAITSVVTTITSILTNIINTVRRIFTRIVGTIIGFVSSAVSAITNFGRSIYNGLKNSISGLASTVWNEISKIPGKIRDGISNAVKAAMDFGKGIKDAVFSALHIKSPGIIQRTVQWEFAEIPGRIKESIPSALTAARDYGFNVVHGFNQSNIDSISDVSRPVEAVTNDSNREININGDILIDAKDRSMHDVAQEIIALFENIQTTNSA